MDEPRADLLSPAFIGGLAGMAIDGSLKGFVVGAAVVWLLLATLLTLAAIAVYRSEQPSGTVDAMIEKQAARRGAAAR